MYPNQGLAGYAAQGYAGDLKTSTEATEKDATNGSLVGEIQQLEKLVAATRECFETHINTISPILLPQMAEANSKDPPVPEPLRSPMATRVRDLLRRVNALMTDIQNTTNRVSLS